jgi:redox-sensitive bicupin YhaK (pirin superfamily)
METILYPSNERGMAYHGWLKAKHTFSFASWYHPEKIHFGALRVLNDDIVAPMMGFGTHPHNDMEIITIPLAGALHHRDSMGHSSTIHSNEVQVMSAGKGIQHSEFNASKTDPLNLFQIWIFPNKQGVEPRYDQFEYTLHPNEWTYLVGPQNGTAATWIHQNAHLSLGEFDQTFNYALKSPGNGIFLMVVEGSISIEQEQLATRDAIGIFNTENITLNLQQKSKVLVIEVPLTF